MRTQFHLFLSTLVLIRAPATVRVLTVRLFYAAALLLSLMLGKICLAATQMPAENQPHVAAAGLSAVVQPGTAIDRDFIAARDAFDKRDLRALAMRRDQFRGASREYPLAAYVDYWWLMANLGLNASFATSNATEFTAFLAARPDSVLADSLRREWLRALGKLDRWDLFLPEAQRLTSEDADLACHQWRYRLSQQDRAALPEALAFWKAGQASSDACYDVFDRIRAEGMIPADIAWPRVRKLLDANQLADARRSAALVDHLPPNFERNTASAGLNPAGYLEREKLNAKSPASIEVFLFAINRLARTDAARAAGWMERRGNAFSAEDRAYAWAQIGTYGAMQHEAAAVRWFEQAASLPLTDLQAGWKARAALRAGDWAQLRAAIDMMSPTEKREPAWRYWLARAESEQGNIAVAAKARAELARETNFYGLLAAEEIGQAPSMSWTGWRPSPADLQAIQQRPAIVRALTLYRLDMRPEGLREWLAAIRGMNDQELLAAAEVARGANVPDRAIGTADRTLLVHDFSQRFPMPFRSDLQAQAKVQGLDEAWVYGLIRQESRFMVDAKSRVGAAGLMQLMPATAKWAAKQIGMTAYSPQRVGDVPVNLALGTFYLRRVLDDLGHPVLATAAYNAGPSRARRWRGETALEGAIYAESIPFSETRDYVKKVMANAWFYAQQAGATKLSLKEMMGTVPGRNDGKAGVSSLISALAAPRPQTLSQ